MNDSFQTAYKQLNKRQKEAVDTIDGPLLVVAGPGTGKTQLLSLRVAQILQQTDTDAGNILCLTFTNFAATNMRERLTKLIGPSARNVVVRTFHSFAAEIMNLYPDYFWNGARLSIAPDALQIEIVQTLLTELPLDDPLAMKFAGSYTAIKDVQSALQLAKEAGLSPVKLRQLLQANLEYIDAVEPVLVGLLSANLQFKKLTELETAISDLPNQVIDESLAPLPALSTIIKDSLATAIAADSPLGKTTNTGKWKSRWLQTVAGQKSMLEERKRIAWWFSLATVYERYREALHAHGFYDYSDMVIEVISQLEQHDDLLASVQERFLYVLLDEFQDTNKAQFKLADLVASHIVTEGRPNIMAVGDDDQAIFAFNGAELSNMLTFQSRYLDVQTVVLADNYRSSQAILDTAANVIEQANDRLATRNPDLSKQLTAQRPPLQTAIDFTSYPTRDHQLTAVADDVAKQWQRYPERQIAVLARSHDSLERISSLLTELKVPLHYERQQDILGHQLVQLILLIAETILAIGEGEQRIVNHHLSRLLQHPVWQLEPLALWQLAVRQRSQSDWLEALLQHSDERFVDIAQWLLWLAGENSYQPLQVMLEYLLGLRAGEHLTSPIRAYYLDAQRINSIYLQTLSASKILINLASELSQQPLANLADLVRFYQLNRDLGRTISDSSWFVTGDKAVEVMTVHKSKGLEFDAVYLVDAVEQSWQPRHVGRRGPANMPQPYGEVFDDYVRLMYVALTRARAELHLGTYRYDDQGKEVLATPLLASLNVEIIEAGDNLATINVLETALHWPTVSSDDERSVLQPILDTYSLSPTALIQFLDVTTGGPQAFLETHLLRIPNLANARMAYGTAIHSALQFAQMTKPAPDLAAIHAAYSQSLGEQHLTEQEFARYEPHGHQILQALFVDKSFTLPRDGQAEISLNDVMPGDIRINGKLDHMLVMEDQVLITDYKTGNPLSSFTTRDQAKVIKAWRHRNQLTFYALLCQQSKRYVGKSIEARMVYVEAETVKQLSLGFTPTADDIARLTALIAASWKHIINLTLPDVSHYPKDMSGIQQFEDDLLSGTI